MISHSSSLLGLVGLGWQLVRNPWFFPISFLLYRILLVIYRITLHPLAIYPGPISWQISRIPWHVSLHSGNLHRQLLDIHEKYGPIVRIAPNELSYAHTDAWRDVYANKNFERNDKWFKRPANEPESIMGFNESAHARLRRGFSGAFSDAGVKEMSTRVSMYVDLMASRLGQVIKAADGEAVVDMVSWLNFTTFDISGDLSFGESFGSIKNGIAHPWVEISCQFGKGVAMVASINFVWPINKVLAHLMPSGVMADFDADVVPTDVRQKFAYHRGITREKVGKRLTIGKERLDFIGSVEKYNAEMMEKGSKDKIITREELDENMAIFVFAGSETTSSALSGTLRYLLQNQNVFKKLQKEVRTAFEKEDDINAAAVAQLEYLTAVLNEGLRLAPPPALGVPRQAVKDDVVCGKPVPSGTLVAINQYAANRASFNFAKAEKFIPERFLKDGELEGDDMDMFQPFFIGRHLCIGYKLAWVMMRLILAKLIFVFDIELIDGDQIKDFGQQETYIFWAKEPLMVKLKRRNEAEHCD